MEHTSSPVELVFLRHLETYKKTLGTGTRLVLSTDNELLRHLRGPTVGGDEATLAQPIETP